MERLSWGGLFSSKQVAYPTSAQNRDMENQQICVPLAFSRSFIIGLCDKIQALGCAVL